MKNIISSVKNKIIPKYLSKDIKKNESENLVVPVCLSASHIAFGSIRMEPVSMVLGQSSAVIASLAIQNNMPVQDLNYNKLKSVLIDRGQILE